MTKKVLQRWVDNPLLKRRVRLYRKIYRRNPHLWDISEYDPAHYDPYEALELRRNPNLVVSFNVGMDLRWKRATHKTIELKPHEVADIQIVWNFFQRCVRRMAQVQAECPGFQRLFSDVQQFNTLTVIHPDELKNLLRAQNLPFRLTKNE